MVQKDSKKDILVGFCSGSTVTDSLVRYLCLCNTTFCNDPTGYYSQVMHQNIPLGV